ncbi:aldo/keto reductase [Cellulomonas iranensis]|uniref:aldo/keto reductase n=1 Tax=Cellulomonas iranensis TaxID=76862 RepID=UPI000B3C4139|nr:aldo/keto reductase [Cellulomonas iranensis]
METITLGRQGPAVPPLAVGTLPFGTTLDTPTSHRILDAALDAGATFLDTANNYAFWVDGATGDESESTLGGWFAARPGARDRVTLASKIGARPRPGGRSFADALGLGAAAVRAQVDASLARLRTDRLDVLYAHVDDTSVPLEETVGALQAEVRRGTARVIGCSNLTAPRLAAALAAAGDGPAYAVLQQRFTYLTTVPGVDLLPQVVLDDAVRGVADDADLTLIGYSPLLHGAYTRPDKELPEPYRHRGTATQLAALADAAAVTGLDAGQVVLAWMTSLPRPVLPVVGVSSPEQLASAVHAVSAGLPAEVVAALDAARTVGP